MSYLVRIIFSVKKINQLSIVMMLFCLMQSMHGSAQVSTGYIWSQSLQTYTAGTSPASATPADVFATSWDDNTYTGYKFPFNFTYNGTLYTSGVGTIGVDTDGWVAFSTGAITMTGSAAGGSWVSPTDATGVYLKGTANNNGFCGFNSDLEEQIYSTITGNTTNGSAIITAISDLTNLRVGLRVSGTGITNGTVISSINTATASITLSANATATGSAVVITPRSSIYAFTRGIAPYRQFVIQWTRATRFNASGDDFSFQLVLNEGGGDVNYQTLQAVYGVCKATNLTPQNAQVGLRGASSADYNARKTATNWFSTTAASTNSDICILTPTFYPTSGRTFTWSPACLAAAGNAGAMSGALNVCPGTSVDYSIAGVPGAIYYIWTYTGGGTTYSDTSTLPLNTLIFGTSATGGTLTVTAGNLCGNGTSTAVSISMSGLPTATISYASATYCNNAAPATVTQTGTSGGTYSASPAGLSINTSNGTITPASSTVGTYTVTYTFTSGCTSTATTTVTISPLPVVSVTATPASVCINGNAQLQANVTNFGTNYSVSSIGYSSLAPTGGTTVLWSTTYTDDAQSAVALPFTFTYYGNAVNTLNVSTNGYVELTSASGTAFTPQTLPNATTPNNVVALAWADLVVDNSTNPGCFVRYFVNGVTPNRIAVVEYSNIRFLGVFTGSQVTGQVRFYEFDNHIEVAAGTVNDNNNSRAKTLGIENSTGTLGITPAGRNNVVWNVTNEAWKFFIPVLTTYSYLWTPSTYLNNTTISNPIASAIAATITYNVRVTDNTTGCFSNTGITITPNAPLNGIYTVGVAGNYPTLTAAVNAYNNICIGGPVVFSLIDANYGASETFPIIVNSNIYQSAANTLTIRPAAGVNATITGSVSNSALIRLSGKFTSINGSNNNSTTRNLSILNTSATSPTVILLGSIGGASVTNCSVKNCNITNGSQSSSAIVLSDATAGNPGYLSNDTILNNFIQKAYIGIYTIVVNTALNGSNILITNNDLTASAANSIAICGIYMQDVDGAIIQGNQVANLLGTDSYDDKGIWLASGTRNTKVLSNRVYNLNYTGGFGYGAYGICITTGVTNANILVANNMIANISGDGFDYTSATFTLDNPVGIMLFSTQTGINLYFNSIYLTGNTLNSTRAISAGIRLFTGSTADIRNNIISNNLGRTGASTTTGYGAIGILASTSNTQFSNLDYNDYSINPTGSIAKYFGQISTTGQTTLATWRTATARDAASINVIPVFTSTTDLHLTPPASNLALNNTGTPITGITIDYDSTTRNGLTPDMGADEFLAPNTGSWVGKTSVAWLEPTNWETNVIPDLTSDVSITGGYINMPTVVTTQAVRGLALSAPVPLNTPLLTLTNSTLQIYGAFTRTGGGTIEAATSTVEMNGSAAQDIPSGVFQNNNLKNLVIGNTNATGVTIQGTLDVYRSVNFSAGGLRLNTNNLLTFKSTATETAWLGNVTGKTITGNATIERYIPSGINHGKSWQLLAAPVRGAQSIFASWQELNTPLGNTKPGFGTTISSEKLNAVSRGYDFYTPTGGPSMKTYDPVTNLYVGVDNGVAATTGVNISNQKGYLLLVRGDRAVQTSATTATPTVLRMSGGLYTASTGQLPPVTTVLANKFATIGNPYPSAIDFTAITRAVGVDNVFYLWDPLVGGSWLLGGYQTISGITGYLPTPGSPNYPAGVPVTKIQSGQAFYVHGTAGGTVTFTEAAKVAGSQLVLRPGSSHRNISMLRVSLYKTSALHLGAADGNTIVLDDDYSNEFDENDALKITHGDENLGILSNEKILAVEARQPFHENDTIYYQLKNLRQQEYQFRFAAMNISSPGLTAWLVDSYLGSRTEISLIDSSYAEFNVSSDAGSAANDRFYIVFKKLEIVPVSFTHISATRTSEKQIRVDWKLENETGIQQYEIERSGDGRSFEKIDVNAAAYNNGAAASYNYLDRTPLEADNFYRVKALSNSGQVQYTAIVKVAPLKLNASISVYPNPLVDNILSISFLNVPAGIYQLKLINSLGQVVLNRSLQVATNNLNESIPLNKEIAKGSYQLSITSGNGFKSVQQVIVK